MSKLRSVTLVEESNVLGVKKISQINNDNESYNSVSSCNAVIFYSNYLLLK